MANPTVLAMMGIGPANLEENLNENEEENHPVSIGAKMMAAMGWKGGGLGKEVCTLPCYWDDPRPHCHPIWFKRYRIFRTPTVDKQWKRFVICREENILVEGRNRIFRSFSRDCVRFTMHTS